MNKYSKTTFLDDLLETLQLEDEIILENEFEYKDATVFIKGYINCEYEEYEGTGDVSHASCRLSEISVQYESNKYIYTTQELIEVETKIRNYLKS